MKFFSIHNRMVSGSHSRHTVEASRFSISDYGVVTFYDEQDDLVGAYKLAPGESIATSRSGNR